MIDNDGHYDPPDREADAIVWCECPHCGAVSLEASYETSAQAEMLCLVHGWIYGDVIVRPHCATLHCPHRADEAVDGIALCTWCRDHEEERRAMNAVE